MLGEQKEQISLIFRSLHHYGGKQEINQVSKICSMSDVGKESKGEKEGHVETEGKSHLNKDTKEERREHHSRLCFIFWWPREAGH